MKKSKFLKKSLAMLLALMLVVAMIPLSASAASSEGPSFIYVDDNTVALPEAEVDVPTGTKTVQMRLNSGLGRDYELRVLAAADTQLKDIVLVDTKDPAKNTVALADYMDSNNEIHLQLYKRVGNSNNWETVEGCTYIVTVNFTKLSTTTDVKFASNEKGIYTATKVDTENKIIEVTAARHTGTTTPSENNTWDEDLQEDGAFKMNITPLDDAHIANGEANETMTVDAYDGATFTVTSASGNNVATYTVKVTSYLEALSEFTVTGTDGEKYSATPVDKNLDDVPDTIVVTLPESAIYDKTTDSSFANPELAVSFASEGDVTRNVVVTQDGETEGTAVQSDGALKVEFTGLGTAEEYNGTVTATRLPDKNGAIQTYDLLVQLEKATSTEITYVKVNNTLGEVDAEAGTLTASVPAADEIAGANKGKSTVTLKTPATVQSVTLNSVTIENGKNVTNGTYAEAAGVATWEFQKVDVSKQQIVDVVAEDGTKQTYTLNVTTDTNTTDATINDNSR